MGTKGREVPRVVCCAIPLASASGKVLVITSRKRQDLWVCESRHFHVFSLFPLNITFVVCRTNISPSWSPFFPSRLECSSAHYVFIPIVPKGGWESSDVTLERAASREALEEGLTLCPSSVCSSPDDHSMLFSPKNTLHSCV